MWTTTDSPLGPVRVITQQDTVTAIEFIGSAPEGASPHSSMGRYVERAAGRPVGERDDAEPLLAEAVRQLRAYFDRDLKEFDLPLAPQGTPFQMRVWDQLRQIGYGETMSYGEIAHRLGMGVAASRAVGTANGRNPIGIVIPCHRVIGAQGKLIGYAGGMDRKKYLLDLEREALF
jgi:methylated-DNA-[protein]-cysteine S-methyltransferase